MMNSGWKEIDAVPIESVVERIVVFTSRVNRFWSSADWWAETDSMKIVSKSRLDWQLSLAACLADSIKPVTDLRESGHLILAWANLGSLVEGTLKLFLTVYYHDYVTDSNVPKTRRVLQEPDSLGLGRLRTFFKQSVWQPTDAWDSWIEHIQQRRNAIHSYQDRSIGTMKEFHRDVRIYHAFQVELDGRLPYPEDEY